MFCKMFIQRIYLCSIFMFLAMSGLYGMDGEGAPSPSQGQTSTSAVVESEFELITTPSGHSIAQYGKENSDLIDLVFLKTINLISDLKNTDGESLIEVDLNCLHPVFEVSKNFFNPVIDDSNFSTTPKISPADYLKRMKDFFHCPTVFFVIALMYVERFITKYGQVNFNQFTFHRIWLSALVTAAKIYDDVPKNNKYYARVGGISTEALDNHELKFLDLMGFGHVVDFGVVVNDPDVRNDPEILQHPEILGHPEFIKNPGILSDAHSDPEMLRYFASSAIKGVLQDPRIFYRHDIREVLESFEILLKNPEVLERPEILLKNPEIIKRPEIDKHIGMLLRKPRILKIMKNEFERGKMLENLKMLLNPEAPKILGIPENFEIFKSLNVFMKNWRKHFDWRKNFALALSVSKEEFDNFMFRLRSEEASLRAKYPTLFINAI